MEDTATLPEGEHAATRAGCSSLRSMIRSVKDMVALRAAQAEGGASSSSAGGSSPPDGSGGGDVSEQRMGELHTQYEAAKAGMRAAFSQLAEARAGGCDGGDHMEVEQGGAACSDEERRRYEQLKAEVEARNETIKALMDESRQLLDAMSMWDAHRKQLDTAQAVALR